MSISRLPPVDLETLGVLWIDDGLRRGWAYRRAVFQRQASLGVYASLRPFLRIAAKVRALII